MIEIKQGNLLEAQTDALVNTVNTEGVMGKGIALQFKQAFPEMFRAYSQACKAGRVQLGRVCPFDRGGIGDGPRWIINFPTKGHWRAKSRLEDIDAGLHDLVATIRRLNIHSIALPPLGCGNGGLAWESVRPKIEEALAEVPDVVVLLFAPGGAPESIDMPNRTARPSMTPGRAALIELTDRYLRGLLDPFVSLLELHKLMYFLQEAGEPLKLNYVKQQYGPYATNLRQVLIKMEGHFLRGYGDGQDQPTKPMELLDGAVTDAKKFLAGRADIYERIERVATLIDGFEDPRGMELLSSVHWVMKADPKARESADVAIEAVRKWSARKQRTMKPAHLRAAWDRLKEKGWSDPTYGPLT